MTKKIWKLNPETVDFVISVCPTPEKAFEILTKADTIFNADQDVATFTIASLNPDDILECKATLKLWRDKCAQLIEVDDFKAPWELSEEELKDLCEDDAEDEANDETDDSEDEGDCNVDDRKRVNVHVVFVGKGKEKTDGDKKDSE